MSKTHRDSRMKSSVQCYLFRYENILIQICFLRPGNVPVCFSKNLLLCVYTHSSNDRQLGALISDSRNVRHKFQPRVVRPDMREFLISERCNQHREINEINQLGARHVRLHKLYLCSGANRDLSSSDAAYHAMK